MNTVPDKCPFCESPIMVHGGNLLRSDNCGFATYECRTVYDTELADNQWKRAEQSMACKTRENQLLTKQRDEARERVKLLEEALESIAERDAAERRVMHLEAALRKIADQDYRGNRSTESRIALMALEVKP